jgi:inorganic pyrophosphatase
MRNLLALPTTSKGLVRIVVETPRGARAKLAYDPKIGVFEYVRPLPLGMAYPYDWGFIPSTIGDDGDPLDGLIIHDCATAPGVVIKCHLLGSLRVRQIEGSEVIRNDRYVLIPRGEGAEVSSISKHSLPQELREEIEQFFLSAVSSTEKRLEFEGWQEPRAAMAAIEKGRHSFRVRR